MLRCNHLFRFQTQDGKIHERWGVVDPGVFSTTINETEIIPLLNTQYKIYLPYDIDTARLYIDKRLAIGAMYDRDGDMVLRVYRITDYDPQSSNYGEDKLLLLKIKSDIFDPTKDNVEEDLCDYIEPDTIPAPAPQDALNVQITYSGTPSVKVGGLSKTFRAVFTNDAGDPVDMEAVWSIDGDDLTGITLHVLADNRCVVTTNKNTPTDVLFVLRAEDANTIAYNTVIVETIGILT